MHRVAGFLLHAAGVVVGATGCWGTDAGTARSAQGDLHRSWRRRRGWKNSGEARAVRIEITS